eukprot:1108177-Prymnesium_polylepis.2
MQAVGLPEDDLKLAPGLKDAVRVHEKALDDYVHDFFDWDDSLVIPETCVIDMIRGTAICGDGRAMMVLVEKLMKGFEVTVQGHTATFFLLRCKNFFAHGAKPHSFQCP